MTNRNRLPARRLSVNASFEHITGAGVQKFHLTVGFMGSDPMEVFLNSSQKSGSEADINASDAAIAVSLALQYGCPLKILREAMRRNADGSPMGPIAHALDLMDDMR